MRRWLLLVGSDLRRRVRNRSALISAVVAPLALGVVFGFLISGTTDGERVIGVVAAGDDASARAVVDALVGADAGPVTFRSVVDESTARRHVADAELDAAVVLPPGFGGPAVDGDLVVLRDPDRQVSGSIANSVAESLSRRSKTVVDVAAAVAGFGVVPDQAVLDAAGALESRIEVVDDDERGELDPGAYFGASMSIMFLFFTVGYVGTSLHVERRTGTLARILSTPTTAGAVVTAKAASVALIGLAGFLVVWAVTTLAFGASWGAVAGVIPTIAATTAAVSGVAVFAVSLARSEQQTEAVTGAVAFTLAILGGNFIGPGQAPELLGRLAVLTPNGWALRTFSDLSTGVAGAADVGRAVGVLLAFGLVFGALGLFRIRRTVAR